MRRLTAFVFILCVALLVAAGGAYAGQMSWVSTLVGGRVNYSDTISANQFNPTLGTLTAITVELETSIDSEVGLENYASVASDLSVDLKVSTELKKGSTTLATKDYQRAFDYGTKAAFDGNFDWGGTSGVKEVHFLQAATNTVSYSVAPADFSQYVGSGTVDFDVSSKCAYWNPVGSGGSMAAYWMADVPARLTVIYDFESVPEPGSLLAIGTGLIGLVGFVSRRKK